MLVQLLNILNRKQKLQAFGLIFNFMFVAIMETLGISVIVPFVIALLQPQQLMQNKYIEIIMKQLKITSENDVVLLAAILIILVYVLKNGSVLFANYIQAKYRNRLECDLSIRMFRAYMRKPYSFHLITNSSEIIRGVHGDTSGVAAVVDAFSGLFCEILTCLLIGIFLICMNPLMAIGILAISGVTALCIVLFFRRTTALCGEKTREAFAKKTRYVYQAMDGIKEITVMQRQENFTFQYVEAAKQASRYNTKYLCISKMPSRVIEIVFIGSLVLLSTTILGSGGSTTIFITQLGALAVASLRILPSISSIANYMNALIFGRPSLESAYENLKQDSLSNSKLINKNEMEFIVVDQFHKLCINHIFWRYQNKKNDVIQDLSLQINRGESIAFIGESGAGKTTLADIILGLFQPQSGTVCVDGIDIFAIPKQWSRLVGYVPQSVFLIDDSIRNNVAFGLQQSEIDDIKVWNALRQAQLEDMVNALPESLDTIMGERGVRISGGQRQRIAIARALYYDPEIIILDEATSALDSETEIAVMESIDALQGEKTLIIVAHRLSTIAKCDKIYEIRNGQAYEKTRDELYSE